MVSWGRGVHRSKQGIGHVELTKQMVVETEPCRWAVGEWTDRVNWERGKEGGSQIG